MASVKEDTIRSLQWSGIEKFATLGMQFIIGLVLARLLFPSDFGTVGMITIFISISQALVDSNFNEALIRKQDRTEVDFSTTFFFNLATAVFLYAVLFFTAPLISRFFNTPVLTPILRVQSVILIFGALMNVHNAKLTIDLNFKAIAQRSILSTLISGAIGIICAVCGLGVWSLVVQTVLAQLTNLIFVCSYVKWKPSFIFSKDSFIELGSFGGRIMLSTLLTTTYNYLTDMVIGKFFSAKDLGYYNRGIHFSNLPVSTVNGIVSKVLFPIMVKKQDNDAELIHVYRKNIKIMSIVIFFGCTLLATIAEPLIVVLITDKWLPSVLYLQLCSFSIMFEHISVSNLALLRIKGRSDLFLRLEVITKVIGTCLLFAALPLGIAAICVSRIIYSQIAIIVNTHYSGSFFNYGYWAQVKDFGGYLAFALISCIPSYLFIRFTDINNILTILITVTFSACVYRFLLRKDEYFLELRDTIKEKIQKKNNPTKQ